MAFTETVEKSGSKVLTVREVQEWSDFYRMVGWMVGELKDETISFQTFVEWYCKEQDMVSECSINMFDEYVQFFRLIDQFD